MAFDLFITPDWTLIKLWIALIIILIIALWTTMIHITSFGKLPLYIPLFSWGLAMLLSFAIWVKPKFESLASMLGSIGPYHIMWVILGIALLVVLLPQDSASDSKTKKNN